MERTRHGNDATAPSSAAEPRWLADDERDAWVALVTLLLQLPRPLEVQLQRDSGITLFEYLVLSSLSMAPERTVRMSELARLANGSLSRLSNVVKRFEHQGWVSRRQDPADGRYTVATLTDPGWDLVQAAAPGHVEAVRHHVIDPLTTNQLRTITAAAARIEARMGEPDCGTGGREQC